MDEMDDTTAEGDTGTGPDAVPPALCELFTEMGRQSLPSPPVPRLVWPELRSLGDSQWGTHPFDPMDHYMFHSCWQPLVTDGDGEPRFTFCHSGHGLNSYFYTLTLRIGPLAVATQSHWSPTPIYANQMRDAMDMAYQYTNLRMLIEGVAEQPGPLRWLLLSSRSRQITRLIDVARLDASETWHAFSSELPEVLDGEREPQTVGELCTLAAKALGFPLDPWSS